MQAAKIGLPQREAQKFFNYYESKGWMVGKNRMQIWRSAMANWKLKWEESRPVAQQRTSIGERDMARDFERWRNEPEPNFDA